jgi:hypothetical protein
LPEKKIKGRDKKEKQSKALLQLKEFNPNKQKIVNKLNG